MKNRRQSTNWSITDRSHQHVICFTALLKSLIYTNFVHSNFSLIGNKFGQIEQWFQLSGKFSPHKYTFPSAPYANMFLVMVLQWYLLYIKFCSSVSELHSLCRDSLTMKPMPMTSWATGSQDQEQINPVNSVILVSSVNSTFTMGWLRRYHGIIFNGFQITWEQTLGVFDTHCAPTEEKKQSELSLWHHTNDEMTSVWHQFTWCTKYTQQHSRNRMTNYSREWKWGWISMFEQMLPRRQSQRQDGLMKNIVIVAN